MIRVIIAGIIFMLWAVWARNYYVCEILGECQPPQTDIDSSYLDNIPNTLTLRAGEHVLLEDYPEFYFDYGSHGYTYINGNEKYLAKLAAFMTEHPETKLIVTGFYTKEEKEVVEKSHFYNDLGKARAYTIVNKLIEEYKLPKHRLKGISKLSDTNPIVTPLQFEILGYTPPEIAGMNEEDTLFLEQVQQSILDITYNDKNAKFEYNSEKFQPSASFDIYLDSLQAYFEVNPTAYIMIIGHTDSKGTSSYNQKLGKGRAESVKAYLKEAGIEVNIETASKGESDPIVKDTNEDGSYNIDAMAQNRRVNILVKTE
jgi:outer membrane protein OmpA-like peptidoglycan-associated protein